jgi:iron complex outermembrane recepter protein
MKPFQATVLATSLALACCASLASPAVAEDQPTRPPQQAGEDDADEAERSPRENILVRGKRESGYTSSTQSGGTFGDQRLLDTPFSVTVIPQELLIDRKRRPHPTLRA